MRREMSPALLLQGSARAHPIPFHKGQGAAVLPARRLRFVPVQQSPC